MIITLIEDGLPIGFFEVDATISESYSGSMQLTSNPIEDGSEINDHLIENPDVVTIVGVHSNDPPIIGAALRVSPARAEELDENLEKAMKDGTELDIFTTLRNLVGYVIIDYSPERTLESANGLRFSLTVQKLRKVASSKAGAAPKPSIERAYPEVAIGRLALRKANQAATAIAGAALISLGNATRGGRD